MGFNEGMTQMSKVDEGIKMLFSKMEEFISTKTVVGEAVHIGDVILVPLVDVAFGMGTGQSGTIEEETKGKTGGGGAMGAKMTPSAVIVIVDGTVQLVNVKNQESIGKMIDMIPGILSKFGLDSMFDKKDKDDGSDNNEEIGVQ